MDLVEQVNFIIYQQGGVVVIDDKRTGRHGKVVEISDTGMSVQWNGTNGVTPLALENFDLERYVITGKVP